MNGICVIKLVRSIHVASTTMAVVYRSPYIYIYIYIYIYVYIYLILEDYELIFAEPTHLDG